MAVTGSRNRQADGRPGDGGPSIEAAMRHCIQAHFPQERVFVGPINAADDLAIGFAVAAQWTESAKNTPVDCKVDDSTFDWGPGCRLMKMWARNIPVISRPKRKATPVMREPQLPNDFLLSGSTMYDSQSTTRSDPFSQTSQRSSGTDSD